MTEIKYNFYRKNLKGIRDYINDTIPLYLPHVFKSHFRMTSDGAVHSSVHLLRPIHCSNAEVRYFSRLSDRALILCLEAWESAMLNPISRLGETTLARAGMVEWNGIFRLFWFSAILGQPHEVHPKFQNEIPKNVCSIRSPSRNFPNFWSNGKRP